MIVPPPSTTVAAAQRACLFGAAGDTRNLGVSALQEVIVRGLLERLPDLHLTVFDHGRGRRTGSARLRDRTRTYDLRGSRYSRRLHQPESWTQISTAVRTGMLPNSSARAIRRADAILDISAGDSFSDIYGMRRFRAVTAPKRAALAAGAPLILLPQTYGPFGTREARAKARSLVRKAYEAWARDADSFAALTELLGDAFDPSRHRRGVDLAFALRPLPPDAALPAPIDQWMAQRAEHPVVGLNASGLIYLAQDGGARFGLRLDYRALLHRLVGSLLADTDVRVLLIPHVLGTSGAESDEEVNTAIVGFAGDHAGRVAVAPNNLTAAQTKWLIGNLEWFCGTRMHACIAALSSGVPTAGIAYSLKTRGVFHTVGQAAQVADARALSTQEAFDLLWNAWQRRAETRTALGLHLPHVLDSADRQLDHLALTIRLLATAEPDRWDRV